MATNSYTKQTWEDAPSTNSPISAERLNHMETGIKDNNTGVRALETAVGNVQNLDTTSKEVVGAINQINNDLSEGQLIASVTADGVKTMSTLLKELITNIATLSKKELYKSYIILTDSTRSFSYKYNFVEDNGTNNSITYSSQLVFPLSYEVSCVVYKIPTNGVGDATANTYVFNNTPQIRVTEDALYVPTSGVLYELYIG